MVTYALMMVNRILKEMFNMEKFISIKSLLNEEDYLCNRLNYWQDNFEAEKKSRISDLTCQVKDLENSIECDLKRYYWRKNSVKVWERMKKSYKTNTEEAYTGEELIERLQEQTRYFRRVISEDKELIKEAILEVRQYQKELAEKQAQLDNLNKVLNAEDLIIYQQELQELKKVRAEIRRQLFSKEELQSAE